MSKKIKRFSETGILEFTINVPPVTKKNHGQIIISRKTGKRMYIPSKQYYAYAKEASLFVPKTGINEEVNIQAIFYMPTKRKVDLTNLNEALHDVLVECRCIEDDNCRIVVSTDGSRVRYDKGNPRTEVIITRASDKVKEDKKGKKVK